MFAVYVLVLSRFVTPGLGQTATLPYRPVSAEYSAALDRIIMIAPGPNQLHIYDPVSQGDVAVNLPKPPLSLSISPDGLHAAVGHDSLISYVNLSSASVERTFPVALTVQYITLSSTWVYAISASYYSASASVNIANGAVSNYSNLFYGTWSRYNAAVNSIYGTRDTTSPNDIERYEISTGPITAQTDSIYHGDYPVCGPVFFSPNGQRIYDGCSTVFWASTDPTLDMRYVTTLAGAASVRSLTESAAIKRVAVIQGQAIYPATATNDDVVLLYESDHLNPVARFTLPDVQAGVTNGKRGTIELDTPPGGQISVLGLRANQISASASALTTLPVLANVGTTGGEITHVTFNGGFTSAFYVVNTGTSAAQFALNFFDENGGALEAPLSLPQSETTATGSYISRTLAAGEMLVLETMADDTAPSVSGSAKLSTNGNISVFEIFRWTTYGQEASVPLETRTPASFVLVFDDTNGLTAGVALSNVAATGANVTVNIYDDSDREQARRGGIRRAARRQNQRCGPARQSRRDANDDSGAGQVEPLATRLKYELL